MNRPTRFKKESGIFGWIFLAIIIILSAFLFFGNGGGTMKIGIAFLLTCAIYNILKDRIK